MRGNLPSWFFPPMAPSIGSSMLNAKKFLGLCAALSMATLSFAAEGEGVAPAAAKLIDFGNGWAITNSMATGWATSAIIVLLIVLAVGKASIFPSKGQAV